LPSIFDNIVHYALCYQIVIDFIVINIEFCKIIFYN